MELTAVEKPENNPNSDSAIAAFCGWAGRFQSTLDCSDGILRHCESFHLMPGGILLNASGDISRNCVRPSGDVLNDPIVVILEFTWVISHVKSPTFLPAQRPLFKARL